MKIRKRELPRKKRDSKEESNQRRHIDTSSPLKSIDAVSESGFCCIFSIHKGIVLLINYRPDLIALKASIKHQ
jgi:hypothetical protein